MLGFVLLLFACLFVCFESLFTIVNLSNTFWQCVEYYPKFFMTFHCQVIRCGMLTVI